MQFILAVFLIVAIAGPTLADLGSEARRRMIAGHFGFAVLVKSKERSTPLWLLMFSSVWLDIVFVPLFVTGIETLQPVANHRQYGGSLIHADFTHSMAGALLDNQNAVTGAS